MQFIIAVLILVMAFTSATKFKKLEGKVEVLEQRIFKNEMQEM